MHLSPNWRGIADSSKSVTFLKGTLQDFDPRSIIPPASSTSSSDSARISNRSIVNLGRVGYQPALSPSTSRGGTSEAGEVESGFDVIWCQWCLGHMNDAELVAFFKSCKSALRSAIDESDPRTQSLIIVKENTCFDEPDGSPATVYDPQDSSVTR